MRGNFQVFKWLIPVISMFILCFFLFGCSSFQVNGNLNGKNIIYDSAKCSYFIQEDSLKSPLLVKYNQKVCAIFCVLQSRDKTRVILKVETLRSKVYHGIRMPQRFILLVSKNRVVYNMEAPDFTSIRWIDNNQFLIIREHQRLIIDKNGKIISNEECKNNLLKRARRDTIF